MENPPLKINLDRVQALIVFTVVVFAVLALNLFYIQVIKHDDYSKQANSMQVVKETILPERGEIYIRDNSGIAPLVLNESVYTIFADPQEIKNKNEVIEKVRSITGEKYIADESLLDDETLQYVVLARGVSREDTKKIKDFDLDGVGWQAATRRVYPEGGLAAQTLGFVNSEGEGQYGIEEYLNKELTGTPGILQSVTDVRRIPLTIGQHDVREPAINGKNIVLTLDRNIQSEVESILAQGLRNVGATTGSVLVMNPQTGEVLAMANFPTYDPAEYMNVQDGSVFQNAVVSNAFEPGSVVKTMSTAAAIDSGAVRWDSTFYNPGCVQVDDAKICNTTHDTDGTNVSMTTVLQLSLNTGVVWELEQMGGGSINAQAKNKLYNYYHDRYRLDELTGIEQSNENEGMIYKPDHEQGGAVNYANMTFGQGFRTTMIELLTAFSAVINGGTYYRPQLVAGTLNDKDVLEAKEREIVATDVVNPSTSEEIKKMMIDTRRENGGDDRGYNVGAKSGTAEVYDASIGDYSKDQFVGTYMGFGADASGEAKYAILVRVDDAKVSGYAGSEAAGPIFTKISNWIIDYKGISK